MKTIGEILGKNNSPLAKLIKKNQDTRNLASVFQSMLDASLAKNCQFANLEGSVVNVTVKNAAWATRIRYAIPDMLKNLRTQPEFRMITSIRYFVDRPTHAANPKKKKTAKLSSDNEVLWQETLARLKKKAKKS
ncbi:conserved hypothetical protein [Gammaproteobacteria bacterium]